MGARRSVFKTLMAILTVLAILAARGLLRLPLLPFRAVRSLLKGRSAPA